MRNQTKTAGTAQEITDFWYDPNGNQISSMTISTGGTDVAGAGIALVGADNTSSYSEYNSWNQLTKTMQNGKTASYTYNGDGLRMSKTVNGTKTSHIWDGTNIAADASGSTVTKYIRGLQLISSEKGVFPIDDSLFKMLYLAMMDITKKWTGRRRDWGQIHSQLEIFFADRISY